MTRKQSGFTLAELLIALALLGVIAAFTIPKILVSTAKSENTAKVREALSVIEQTWYNLQFQNQQVSGAGNGLYENISSKINSIASGTTGLAGTGCPAATYPKFVQLANGTVIAMSSVDVPANLAQTPAVANTIICIDVNGTSPPNQYKSDTYGGNFNPGGVVGSPGYSAPSEDGKKFFWGNLTTPVVDATGTALNASNATDGAFAAGRYLGG